MSMHHTDDCQRCFHVYGWHEGEDGCAIHNCPCVGFLPDRAIMQSLEQETKDRLELYLVCAAEFHNICKTHELRSDEWCFHMDLMNETYIEYKRAFNTWFRYML